MKKIMLIFTIMLMAVVMFAEVPIEVTVEMPIVTIDKQLNDALGTFINDIQNTKEFVIEQAPVVVQEIYDWNLFKYNLMLWIGIMLATIAIISSILWIILDTDDYLWNMIIATDSDMFDKEDFYEMLDLGLINYLPFMVVEKLYQWHFDIHGLIEKC